MYIPKHFEPTDQAAEAFLGAITSGHLVSNSIHGLVSTFIPVFFCEASNSIVGHLARGNPQWSLETMQAALFIATVTDPYISPSLYASKKLHGKVVPTWDYMIAHVYGDLIIHDDVDWLREQVSALTDKFEAARPKPWRVDDAPEDYVAGQLKAIVGVELKVTRLEVSFKMSQNKSIEDLEGVIQGLAQEGKIAISEQITQLRPADKFQTV